MAFPAYSTHDSGEGVASREPNGVMASGRTYVSGHAFNGAQRTTYREKLIAAPPLALPSFEMKMYAKTGESDGSGVELQKVERRHSLREGIVR